jgi:nitrogen regulatory protein P-II 1
MQRYICWGEHPIVIPPAPAQYIDCRTNQRQQNTKPRSTNMKKVEAIIQPFKFEEVKEALIAAGVEGMTVTQVKGFGRQKGHLEIYRSSEYTVDVLPKVKVEVVAPEDRVDLIVKTIKAAAFTGKIGDSKILVSPLDEAHRIRTQETAELAV